jgi:hypothetical protein
MDLDVCGPGLCYYCFWWRGLIAPLTRDHDSYAFSTRYVSEISSQSPGIASLVVEGAHKRVRLSRGLDFLAYTQISNSFNQPH